MACGTPKCATGPIKLAHDTAYVPAYLKLNWKVWG